MTKKILYDVDRSKKIAKTYGKAKAKARRLRETTLQEILANAQILLEGAP